MILRLELIYIYIALMLQSLFIEGKPDLFLQPDWNSV